ncbi:MAG: hypothetical protein AB1631_14545 [Acidobacteriota bacterium]
MSWPLRLVEELSQDGVGCLVFGQHATGRHFANVCGREVYTKLESVLQFGQLDALRINRCDDLIEFLLRSDDDPDQGDGFFRFQPILAHLAELLDDGPQVFDLVGAAGYVLADLIDDEDEGMTVPPRVA